MRHPDYVSPRASGLLPDTGEVGRKATIGANIQRRDFGVASNRQSEKGPRSRFEPILDRDPTEGLWRGVGIPKSRDIRRLLPAALPRGKRFETLSDVAERKRKLVERLQDLEPDLADAYDNCAPEARCSIPGCPYCSRLHRGYRYSETARVNELPLAGPRFYVTVYLATIPEGQLPQARISDAHKKIRKRLERLGFQGVLIGGTEANWVAKRKVWILHLHILSIGVEPSKWDALATSMSGADSAIPVKREELKDTVSPLSYMQKWATYFRPRRRIGNKLSRAVPLKPRQVAELCSWWASHRFEDFMFLLGARRRGGRIVPDPRVSEVGTVGTVGTPRVIFSRTFTLESIHRDRTTRFIWRDEISVINQISASPQDKVRGQRGLVPPDLPNPPLRAASWRQEQHGVSQST